MSITLLDVHDLLETKVGVFVLSLFPYNGKIKWILRVILCEIRVI